MYGFEICCVGSYDYGGGSRLPGWLITRSGYCWQMKERMRDWRRVVGCMSITSCDCLGTVRAKFCDNRENTCFGKSEEVF